MKAFGGIIKAWYAIKNIKQIACFPQFQWPSGKKFLHIINKYQIYVLKAFGGVLKAW